VSGPPSCDNYLCGACQVRPEMILKQEAVIPRAVSVNGYYRRRRSAVGPASSRRPSFHSRAVSNFSDFVGGLPSADPQVFG
jgi:hypothetical protein